MLTRKRLVSLVSIFSLLLTVGTVRGSEPIPTTITIPKMDCGGCAKKIAAKLTEVAGVAKAEPNVEARTIKVTAKANVLVSPKALWEAVEKADKKPTKLEGPSGAFTSKPNS